MEIREVISASVIICRSKIENSHSLYGQKYSDTAECLNATAIDTENGHIIESIPMLLSWDDVRIKLQERNKTLINLSGKYVSGAVKL